MAYLRFDRVESFNGKTKKFSVVGQTSQTVLGEIRWFAPWRRYAFAPANGCLFDAGCMFEIVAKIEHLMLERRRDKADG